MSTDLEHELVAAKATKARNHAHSTLKLGPPTRHIENICLQGHTSVTSLPQYPLG